jgi:hypothetical protein
MAVVSLLGSLLALHLRRNPVLLHESAPVLSAADQRRASLRGPVMGVFFLLIGLVSLVAPATASWLPLGIIPLSIWLRPAAGSVGDDS